MGSRPRPNQLSRAFEGKHCATSGSLPNVIKREGWAGIPDPAASVSGSTAQRICSVLLATATATTPAGLRASKKTAPPWRRRCSIVTFSRDGVFSSLACWRACPRVFCVAALVFPQLLPHPRSQALRRAVPPQLLRGSRRGTSASFAACCYLLPCILSSMGLPA